MVRFGIRLSLRIVLSLKVQGKLVDKVLEPFVYEL